MQISNMVSFNCQRFMNLRLTFKVFVAYKRVECKPQTTRLKVSLGYLEFVAFLMSARVISTSSSSETLPALAMRFACAWMVFSKTLRT